ncbi:MAG TPA: ATP-binding protein [Pseudonocardia sp.]|uniref:sensor histidine kinase n=1 Tax=Pseudonocardia sp. TaxID=60912 RepID=UPI002B4AD1D6|nr:ATP-binding protein [Pseudonocardia sp.]HLU58431.1 ATP-binding protein [Pseudonocardia sp.]
MRAPARMSVRLRATLAATAVVAVALGVASAVLVSVLAGSLADSAAAEAERRAAQTVEMLTVPDPPVVESPLVVGPDVVVRPAQPGVPPPTFTQNERFAVASVPVMTADGEVLVQARASLHPAAAALDTLRSVLLPGVPALLLLVAGLTFIAVGRALAPVSAIRRELADITATDLHRRVPVPEARDEIRLLAETTNRTLDRLEHAVDRHRRFVADAAHELRSPLAVLRTRLEVAPPQPLTTEALADVDRIQRLTADLLLLARLDAGEPAEHEEVDLGQVAAEEAARARPRSDVRVDLRIGPGIVVRGSAEQLRRLVANLVDNAVRHAAGAVTVRLAARGGEAVLDVCDDGPGIPPDQQAAVFDRFTRLDEARARDAGGSGLGLAIARDIAVRHAGTLAVAGGPPGAVLRARFPIG